MNNIILTDNFFIKKGTGRVVYLHPYDNSKIIKISIEKKLYHFLEILYLQVVKDGQL